MKRFFAGLVGLFICIKVEAVVLQVSRSHLGVVCNESLS